MSLEKKFEDHDYERFNQLESNERPLHLLNIPVVGGLLYIVSSVRRAYYWKKKFTALSKKSNQFYETLQDVNAIKIKYRKLIDNFLLEGGTHRFRIPSEYTSIFYTVVSEYDGFITLTKDSEEDTYILIVGGAL